MLKHLPLLFFLVASALHPILAAVVTRTVYYIGSIETPTSSTNFPTPSNTLLGTTRYSAIQTAENGNTKYDMEVVLSLWVQEVNGEPQTLISTPYTRTYTLEENASHLALSAAPSAYATGAIIQQAGTLQNCDIDVSNMKGKCVQVDEVPVGSVKGTDGNLQDRIITVTTTYTAAITPVATFTVTGGDNASATSGASKSLKESGLLCVGLLAGSLMASWFAPL